MNENLEQHRSGSNVWEGSPHHDVERRLTAFAAGVCLAAGLKRRSTTGLWLSIAGAALAWWAAADPEERRIRRASFARRRSSQRIDSMIDEASEASFPASDPPAVRDSRH